MYSFCILNSFFIYAFFSPFLGVGILVALKLKRTVISVQTSAEQALQMKQKLVSLMADTT